MAKIAEIIQYEGDNSTFIWKHPSEDFNSLSQLIVHESQEAIFFLNGQALDLFGAGRHTLETQNIPMLGKLLNRTTNGETPFHCEVYFINKTVQMGVKWGTGEKVRFLVPDFLVPIEIGAYGEMNLAVSDSRKLLLKLVGTMNGIAWEDRGNNFTKSIQQSFRPLISMGVRSHLPVAIKSNHMDIFEIDEHLEELSEGVRQRLLVGFEEYGLTIPQFYISHVELPDPKKDLNFGRMVELHTLSLQSRMIQADKSIRIEQSDADTSVKVAQAENDAIVRQALRKREEERQITMTEMEKHKSQRELIQAQTEAQKTLIRANAAAVAKQEIGLAEAKVMEAKGYDQKDVFQKDVQIEQAKSIGNMTINGSGGGMASEMMSMVAGMAAANAFVPQFSNMFSGMMPAQAGIPVTPAPMTSAPAVSASEAPETGEKCAKCGASLPENAKFCLECGEKVAPKIPDGMIICPKCGATVTKSKFCMECGYKFVTVCPSCGKNVADGAKFCMECGTKL